MLADNRAALAAATQQRAEQARTRARAAIRQLDRDGVAVTFAAVAAAAGVSRSLLYRDPDLHAEIDQLRTRQPSGPVRRPTAERASDGSLQQRLATLLADNHALRDENRKLRDQIAALLGQQRATNAPARPRPPTLGPCS